MWAKELLDAFGRLSLVIGLIVARAHESKRHCHSLRQLPGGSKREKTGTGRFTHLFGLDIAMTDDKAHNDGAARARDE